MTSDCTEILKLIEIFLFHLIVIDRYPRVDVYEIGHEARNVALHNGCVPSQDVLVHHIYRIALEHNYNEKGTLLALESIAIRRLFYTGVG